MDEARQEELERAVLYARRDWNQAVSRYGDVCEELKLPVLRMTDTGQIDSAARDASVAVLPEADRAWLQETWEQAKAAGLFWLYRHKQLQLG